MIECCNSWARPQDPKECRVGRFYSQGGCPVRGVWPALTTWFLKTYFCRLFGSGVVSLNPILKQLPKIFDHKDAAVRQQVFRVVFTKPIKYSLDFLSERAPSWLWKCIDGWGLRFFPVYPSLSQSRYCCPVCIQAAEPHHSLACRSRISRIFWNPKYFPAWGLIKLYFGINNSYCFHEP